MKAAYLLDVNLLVALMWPAHDFHDRAQDWFRARSRQGWATCAITQAGFVRIVSNPAFSRDAVSPPEAIALLAASLAGAHHIFWPGSVSYEEATLPFVRMLRGHRQITDAYLLGLAIHNGGRLATFEKGIAGLVASPSPHARCVEVLDN